MKDAYSVSRIDDSLSKLGDAKFFLLTWTYVLSFGESHCAKSIQKEGFEVRFELLSME